MFQPRTVAKATSFFSLFFAIATTTGCAKNFASPNGSGSASGGASSGGAPSNLAGFDTAGGGMAGSACPGADASGLPAPGGWNHPGAIDSKDELDFVKAKIAASEEPWKSMFTRLQSSSLASRTPNPLTNIDSSGNDANTSRDDATAAYTQALLWYYSGDAKYAEGAIAILNAWSGLQGFSAGTDQDKLQAGWIGALFAPAAEIMRVYPGWNADDIAKFAGMFERAFYPQLNTMSTWNGNVDLTQIDAMMGIAVFLEDEVELERAVDRFRARVPSYFYLVSDGTVPPIGGDGGDVQKFWSNPSKWVNGLQQETCRDNGHHAQFGLGSAIHAAETAWHQGIDLYSQDSERFVAAFELLAKQFNAGDMLGVCADGVPTLDRYDTWEIGFNHYRNRKCVPMPETERLIVEQIRPSSAIVSWNLAYETLTHANVP